MKSTDYRWRELTRLMCAIDKLAQRVCSSDDVMTPERRRYCTMRLRQASKGVVGEMRIIERDESTPNCRYVVLVSRT